jgi:soluble lytic murein transglycosylase-like protein
MSVAACAVVFGFAGTISGLERDEPGAVVAVSESEKELHRHILDYIVERNPDASLKRFRNYPAVVIAEAARTGIDHCLALAQAQAESNFRPDAVGSAGEIGLYQILPSTAELLVPLAGSFRRPSVRRLERDLGDLADPVVSTRFAMAYLRDILARKPTVRAALIEYNGGPRYRQPHYYRTVMATYVEILERPSLGCRFREAPAPNPRLIAFAR